MKKRKSNAEELLVKEEPIKTEEDSAKVVIEHKADTSAAIFNSGDEWPFEGLCEQLCLDLFSPYWEVRHGSALAIREIVKVQGSGAGKITGQSRESNDKRHSEWLADLSIRLLCVLALDKFTDFVGDQAVVPVRETCAQALGVVSRFVSEELCSNIIDQGLLKLIAESKVSAEAFGWGVRLAALIGLKYILAVRSDLTSVLLVKKGAFSDALNVITDG